MHINFKKKVSNIIHENFKSHFINFNNRHLKKSYNQIFEDAKINISPKYNKLLIDGSFYNLGYFYRLQIFRAAIKHDNLKEHAYIWNYNKKICRNILNSFGIKSITDLSKYKNKKLLKEAEKITKSLTNAREIINFKFPEGIPGFYLYDIILKLQRNNSLNIYDKNLKWYIFEYLSAIDSSKKLLLEIKPDIVALSHTVSFQCAPMGHLSSKYGIPTFILSGNFGAPRFIRIKKPSDFYFNIPHPTKNDIDSLDKLKAKEFAKIGFNYLEKRKLGKFLDFGGRLAFGKGKKEFDIEKFINLKKKVVAIYCGCWFDFPHAFGMNRFLDVLEWIKTTIEVASNNKDVIWLIKPHPAEKWYGGTTLKDSLPNDLAENIIILPNDYDGKAIMKVSDALITFHGTSALEYASAGKPVLVADIGWYHDCGFVVFPKSRNHYLDLLKTNWYDEVNIDQIRYKANLFAGIYFGVPYWQRNALLPCDTERETLFDFLPKHINFRKNEINKEICLLKDWLKTDKKDYHTYKLLNSEKNIVEGNFKAL